MGTFANILPYANALLMVIKEISKAIADMFGIELTDYNSGIASQEGIYDGIADSADEASSAVKELKRQVLGFDEIHNINENKDSGSGSNLTGGIDQRLLDAITGYDNGMDKVRMKATEIRDRIMEWLGFTKEINPLTGEVSFKLKDGETRFKTILEFIKGIKDVALFALEHADTIIKTIIGYKIAKKLIDIFKGLKNIKDVIKDIASTDFGKLGIAVGTGLGLAELVSTTDWYKQFTGGRDFIQSWSYIFSTSGEIDKQNFQTKNDLGLTLMRQMALYEQTMKDGNTELATVIKSSIKDYTNIFSDEELSAIEQAYQKNKELINQMVFGESFIGGDGLNVESYTKSLQDYFGTIVENYDSVENYVELIERSKTAYQNAEEELGILLAQMNTDQYEVTAEDIDKINSCLETMKQSAKESGQASVDAITKLVLKYQEQGIASAELTQQIITDAKKKQLAEQGYTEEYINKVVELEKQLKNGKITQEQYTKSLIDIYNEYNKTTDIVDKKKIIFENLSKNVEISASSFDELENSIKIASSNYESGMTSIETSSQQNLDFLSEYIAGVKETYGEESEEYKRSAKLIEDENKSKLESIKKLKDGYATYLNNILIQLVNSKYWGSEKSKELYESINSELSKLGYGVEADVEKNLAGVKEELKMNDVKIGSGLKVDNNGIKEKISKMLGSISSGFSKFGINLNFSSIFKEKGGVYANGSWKDIPQYANGGAPSHGTMFWAGENGPEIVAHANGKTEVLNQSQIASAIYSAVYSAMSQFGGQSVQVELYAHTDEGVVVDRINQKTRQTGVCPVNIPIH